MGVSQARTRAHRLFARAPCFNFIALAPDLGDELWADTINSWRGQVLLAFFTTCHKGGSRSNLERSEMGADIFWRLAKQGGNFLAHGVIRIYSTPRRR
jgi:hypothetical protein